MKTEIRSYIYVFMGIGSLCLSIYLAYQTLMYMSVFRDDSIGGVTFGVAGAGLLVVAVAHFYLAAGYRFGRLDTVSGTLENATLKRSSGLVAENVKINFVRRLDADDASLAKNGRYVFFISKWKPWVCPESHFLRDC